MNSTETESGVTATLKTVAAAAGVSIRTAGRALSGSGPVKAEVASRVLQAARELNYVPNAAARNLDDRTAHEDEPLRLVEVAPPYGAHLADAHPRMQCEPGRESVG